MVYIVGVNHDVQTAKSHQTNDFVAYVKLVCKEKEIQYLAEEWNFEIGEDQKVKKTTVLKISKELKLKHINFEPTIEEKKSFGMPTQLEVQGYLNTISAEPIRRELAKWNPERELIWFRNVKDVLMENILIICGSDHISSHNPYSQQGFDTLLIQKGIQNIVLPKVFNESGFEHWLSQPM